MFLPSVLFVVVISMQVGIFCTIIGLPIALIVGWILARKEFLGKSLFSTICLTPVVLPPVVTGFLILSFLGNQSMIGTLLAKFGVVVPFTLTGAVLAALVVGLPFYIIGTRTAFDAVDSRLEEVAKSMGHSPTKVFFSVTLPLALPGICGGAVLAFARSLGEFGATAVVAGNMEGETRTIALAIYSLLEAPDGNETIMQLVWISISIAFIALLAYEGLLRLQRKRLDG